MKNSLVRPVVLALTFVFVVVAIMQAAGRIAMAGLHRFEDDINLVLGTQDIRLTGLEGSWQGLNPVFEVSGVQSPVATVEDVRVELDVVESIFENALVPRLAHIGEVRINVDHTDEGWRVRGLGGETNIDFGAYLRPILRHADHLSVVAQAVFTSRDGATGVLDAEIEMINRGSLHFVSASLKNSEDDEALVVSSWEDSPFWGAGGGAGSRAVRAGGSIRLPDALSGMQDLMLVVGESHWDESGSQGGGLLSLAARNLEIAPETDPLMLRVALKGSRREEEVHGVLSDLVVSAGSDELSLGSPRINVELPSETESSVQLSGWLESLDLGEVSTFVARHLSTWEPAGRWIREMDIRGKAHNLHVFSGNSESGNTELGYLATLDGLVMKGYKGAPTLSGGQGRVWGYAKGVAIQLNAKDVELQFPDLFLQKWQMNHLSGVVKGWFGPGYFAMRGNNLYAERDETAVAGQFTLTRPDPRYEQRVGLLLTVDEVDMDSARDFIPYKIPEELTEWLSYGPRAGQLSGIMFAYQGQVHTRPGELGRRIELASGVQNGRVVYDREWPEVHNLRGRIHVAGSVTRVEVHQAQSRRADVSNSWVTLVDNGRYAEVTLAGQTATDALLDFVRMSPLTEDMSFVTPEWQGGGELAFDGQLVVPIKEESGVELGVDFDFTLLDADLVMPDYRTRIDDLNGTGTFSLPHHVTGTYDAEMFGNPVVIEAASDDDWLRFSMVGTATPEDVYRLIEYDETVPVSGQFEFDGKLSLAMQDGISNLAVTTDLLGLAVDLPAEFGKEASARTPAELDVQFLTQYQSVRWRYKTTDGWLHYGDAIERGAIGINGPPPMTDQDNSDLLISGHMPRLQLSDWVSESGESSVALPLDWSIRSLRVEQFVIDELVFPQLTLSGEQRGEDVSFVFDGDTLAGNMAIPETGLMDLHLDYVQLPDPDVGDPIEQPEEDPLTVDVGRSLPAARVNVAQLDLGTEPFGSWRFVIDPVDDVVYFRDFETDVNGVHIREGDISWDLNTNASFFKGGMDLDDLQQTLPLWEFAPSLQTDEARLEADATWVGSPVNVSLLGVDGRMIFNAGSGRFLEVESAQGGLRMFSLINFSKIAQRISFDFSDVVGEGISFDRIDADITLRQGQVEIQKPMIVDSSSGYFQVAGGVDLHTGELDNEMIVTLPVSKSLPWYGVYLALANPLAGLGVLVGERVLRKPIEQLSSAKYDVSGTLDNPEVNFVGLWDQSLEGGEVPSQEVPDSNKEEELEGENPTAQLH